MSTSICQRPSSIDRRDKRLGNGQARSRRLRVKRAVGPIRPFFFRVHANYLDALNASRVRIHRQKPKALGLKFGCGFTRHLFHQGSPASGSAAIFETGSKATTTPVAPAVPRVFAFYMQAEQSIVVDPKSPGGIYSPHGLILFDGVCVLCSRGCRFVSKRDRPGYFRFVPIQLAEVCSKASYESGGARTSIFSGCSIKRIWSQIQPIPSPRHSRLSNSESRLCGRFSRIPGIERNPQVTEGPRAGKRRHSISQPHSIAPFDQN
jgi:DCC1-like thiol-disulfide oxidoreductase